MEGLIVGIILAVMAAIAKNEILTLILLLIGGGALVAKLFEIAPRD